MKSKNLIKILIIILVIVLIGILIFALFYNKKTNTYSASPSTDIPIVLDTTLKDVKIRNNYYAVESCIKTFYYYYDKIYDDNEDYSSIMDEEAKASLEIIKKQNVESVYNMLDDDYKSYKNATIDNLTEKLSPITVDDIYITDMYVIEKTENISIYFVYGYLIDESSSNKLDFSTIVKVDMLNRTFSMSLEDYVKEYYKDIKIGEDVNINYPSEIKNNNYNAFRYENISDEAYVNDMFNNLKQNMIYNTEEVYKNLDEEYKQKRFAESKDFNEFVNNRTKEIIMMSLSKYQKKVNDEYTQYICLTNANDYIIINEVSPTKCTFILDSYTLDLPEFVEKYNNGNNQQKVALNIDKFIKAINNADYKYAYNCLADSFKQNYFKTQEEFTNYAKENFFESNEVGYKEFDTQGDVYTYSVSLTDKNSNKTVNKTFIMKLEEGTDFVMSFDK